MRDDDDDDDERVKYRISRQVTFFFVSVLTVERTLRKRLSSQEN